MTKIKLIDGTSITTELQIDFDSCDKATKMFAIKETKKTIVCETCIFYIEGACTNDEAHHLAEIEYTAKTFGCICWGENNE